MCAVYSPAVLSTSSHFQEAESRLQKLVTKQLGHCEQYVFFCASTLFLPSCSVVRALGYPHIHTFLYVSSPFLSAPLGWPSSMMVRLAKLMPSKITMVLALKDDEATQHELWSCITSIGM